MAYDNKTKYKIIEEVCNGKTSSDIQREYGIGATAVMRWLRTFAENGPFKGDKLTPKDYARLEKLQESAKKRELEMRFHGTTTNESFEWLLEYDPALAEWKAYAEEWIKTVVRGKDTALAALSSFFKRYIIAMNLARSVQEFVSKTYEVPDFYEILYSAQGDQAEALKKAKKLVSFIDWILEEKFSVEDDYGKKLIPAEFHNPLEQYLPDHVERSNKSESNKNVLPYRYIKELRNLLGGTYVNDDTDKVTYGPVQGYPAHNCVRCRWFITGPAFLPGLVNHFNVLSYEMAETSKRVTRYQNKTEELENSKYEAEQHGEIFEQYEDLLNYEQLLQQELQKGDDIANNLNATLRLIDKCHKISKSGNDNDSSSTQLVPVGTVQDVGFLLEAEADEMHQLQAICNGAELFPETDASKALLKRSQIIDMTLLFNKKQPVMFTLSDEEQLLAGNQFMRLLIKRAGSLKEAIPYAIGRKKLEEIGIHNEFEKELKIMRYDAPLKLLSTNNDA